MTRTLSFNTMVKDGNTLKKQKINDGIAQDDDDMEWYRSRYMHRLQSIVRR